MYNVPVIDMTLLTTQLYTNLYNYGGADETAKMHCYTDTAHTTLDNTHLSNAGAYKIANMIAAETQKLGLAIGNY
jgi:lysophospholipase L1-like esterase